MKPEEIIKYVFNEEGFDYGSRFVTNRDKDFVQVKQRSMYLIKYFYPHKTWIEIGSYLGFKHDMAIHNCNKVTNFIATEKKYNAEMSKYIKELRRKIKRQFRVRNNSIEFVMLNKRIILFKRDEKYVILAKSLNNGVIERQQMTLSDEAMNGLIESFKILTNK